MQTLIEKLNEKFEALKKDCKNAFEDFISDPGDDYYVGKLHSACETLRKFGDEVERLGEE